MTTQTRPAHPVDRLWRLLVTDRVLATLIVLIALTAVLGLVLPQVPDEVAQQQEAAARWLAEAGSHFGGAGRVMQQAGLFSLWQSPWLRLLLAALAFVLLLRFAQATTDAVHRLRHSDPLQTASDARHWPHQAALNLSNNVPTALAELAENLRQEGWTVATRQGKGEAHVTAERSVLGVLATPLVIAGMLVMLMAGWVGQVFGWSEAGLVLVPGQPVSLSHGDGLTLTLNQDDAGTSEITLQGTGTPATTATLAGQATRLSGMTVRRTGGGQVVRIAAVDTAGAPLSLRLLDEQAPLQSSVALVFDQPRAERTLLVPERQLAISVVAFPALPERGFNGPTFLVQAFQVGRDSPVFNEFIAGDTSVPIEGDRFDLRRDEYITVRITRNPGQPLLLLGAAIAVAGAAMGLWRPAGQLHLHLQPGRDQTHVAASLRPSSAWRQARRWFSAWAATYSEVPSERIP